VTDDAEQDRIAGEHPSSEKLSAYQANELSPAEDDAIQEHLVGCSLCVERLLELQQFLEFAPEGEAREGVADLETAAEWRKLRGRILGTGKIVLSRLAASLILGLLLVPLFGISWWLRERSAELKEQVVELQGEIAELRTPQVGVPVEHLEGPRDEARQIPAGRTVDLDLRTSAPKDYAEYLVEIAARDGQVLWSSPLKRTDSGTLTFRLVGGFLEPGVYRIRLAGIQGGRRELLEEYLLRVRSE
jgi:hypothetical protein